MPPGRQNYPGLRNRGGACALSHVQLCVTPWTVARQAPPSTERFKQAYWNGLPFLTPGDLPNAEIKPLSPASPALAGGFSTAEPPGKPENHWSKLFIFQC